MLLKLLGATLTQRLEESCKWFTVLSSLLFFMSHLYIQGSFVTSLL